MANFNGGIVGVDNPPVEQPEVITTFNASGNLTTAPYTTEVQYVIVAGGGGGDVGAGSGGGGAGGYRSSVPGESSGGGASAEPLSPVTGGSPYPVVVGAGGAGKESSYTNPAATDNGKEGSDSSFNGIVSIGGGGAGFVPNPTSSRNGGSGGGASYSNGGGSGTANQGYPGGIARYSGGDLNGGGGGGGAGQAGEDCPNPVPPQRGYDGGDGVASSITGTSIYRAGGGGGCGRFENAGPAGVGGLGGGAPGSDPVDSPNPGGVANSGGGGGGTSIGSPPFTPVPGGNGGSGVVIIKEPNKGYRVSGVWDMNALYDNVKAGTWTNA